MKRTFVKIASKKFMAVTAIAALLSLASFTNVNARTTATSTSSPGAVVYAGTVNNSVSFNINYNNETGSAFNLVVKNENGDIIYSHTYSDKNFSKKFVINELPEDGGSVTFIINGAGADLKQTFNISTITKTVSDVVVTKE